MINVFQNDLDNCEDGSTIKHQNNEKIMINLIQEAQKGRERERKKERKIY